MTYFASFQLPAEGQAGFQVVAGRPQGLRRLLVASGRLPAETGSDASAAVGVAGAGVGGGGGVAVEHGAVAPAGEALGAWERYLNSPLLVSRATDPWG
jgi:hypothetical protein